MKAVSLTTWVLGKAPLQVARFNPWLKSPSARPRPACLRLYCLKMLPSPRGFRLARIFVLASRSFVSAASNEKPSELFIRKNRYMFKFLDVSGDGILNDKDMTAIAARMKVNSKLSEKEFERLNKSIQAWWNGNVAAFGGTKEFNEEDFLKMRTLKWNIPEGEARIFMKPTLDIFFNIIDTDGDGIVSSKEWANYLNAIRPRSNPGEAAEAFRILDTNKDGKLDFEEFYHHVFDFLYSQVESPSTHMFGKVP